MERPCLNLNSDVRSCILLSFESVKTAKKLWREGKHNCWILILTRAWSKEETGRRTTLPGTPPLPRWSPLARESRGTPPPRSSFTCKNLASDKIVQYPIFTSSKWRNQTGIISARKDRKICLVCTTTFCEFLLLIRTDKKLRLCTNRHGSGIREPEAVLSALLLL